jgi:two-component system, NtrC family, nitrogen regulation response regulator NtrX
METILIVDDEEPVRRTFAEWLQQAHLGCEVLTAADAAAALQLANEHPIDLVVLDWALGAGDDGLQLLQDLCAFHPAVVAIMVTGFANQATPLDAMRMGVRDYLDKNHDLSRETFLRAVERQLEQIRPAKGIRQLHQSLLAFRAAVEKVVPLVRATAALNEPVPLPDAIRALVRFLMGALGARDGLLLVRHYDAGREPAEWCRAYDALGQMLPEPLVPFAHSVAGTAASLGQPCAMNDLGQPGSAALELQVFERGRQRLLAVPMTVAPGTQVVIELFDKEASFTAQDQELAQAAAELGTELLRQALGQRQTHRLLLDAVAAALEASDAVSQRLQPGEAARADRSAPSQVLERLRQGLEESGGAAAELSVELAEAIRVVAARHGRPALEHCLRLVGAVRGLLDAVSGGQDGA